MAKQARYVFEVEGEEFSTDDPRVKGRDVRTMSGRDPAARFRLIEILERYTSSVGLEDPVEFEEGVRRVFRIFEGDRDYDFTVEDLGWEWGAPTISEADVRRYGRIAQGRELVVEGPTERVVPRGGSIDLVGGDVERIYSRRVAPPPPPPPTPPRLTVNFVVNGERHPVEARPGDRLVDVLGRALEETENTGRPVDAWLVTDEGGAVLDAARTLDELGVADGAVLIASLRTGEAG